MESKKVLNAKEYAIYILKKRYGMTEEVAREAYQDIWNALSRYAYVMDMHINDSDSSLREEAIELRKRLINDIKSIFINYDIEGLYEIDENGKINLNSDYFMNEDNFNKRIENDKSMYYEVLAIENTVYKPIRDISQEEFDYLESIDFEPQKYNELMKRKMINHMNLYLDDKITDFNMSDIVPIEYRVSDYFSKYYKNGNYDVKEDIIMLMDDVLYSIDELKEKYGLTRYIPEICDYIIKTIKEIKVPTLSKDEMINIIKEYIKEEQIDDDVTFYNYVPIIKDEKRRKKIKEIIEKRFEKQNLEEEKKELEEQKGMLDSTIDSNGPKM